MAMKLFKWAVLPPGIALGAWSLAIVRRVYQIPSINRDEFGSVSLLDSQSCSIMINPQRYQALSDTWSIRIRLPPSKKHYSDEQILATFVKGFFGGWVFAPEGALLRAFGLSLVDFSSTFDLP